MTEHIGSEYVEILPDAHGFAEKFRAQAMPQVDALGREMGQQFGREFASAAAKQIPDVFRRSRPSTTREADQSGKLAGDAFGRAMDTRISAAIKALPDIRIDADSSPAQRKIYELKAELEAAEGMLAIGVDDERAIERIRAVQIKLEELTGPEHSIRVRMDAKAAIAEITALHAALRAVDDETGPAPALKEAERAAHGLLSALIPLVPTIGPIVGAAVAGGAALAEMGVAGILAFKGIQAAEKAGTHDGLEFAAGVRSVKDELAPLEQSAAHGLLDGFRSATSELSAELPGLNSEIERSAHVLGTAGSNVVGGLVGGFDNFEPVLRTVDGLVVQASQHFEDWATGPGGANFAANLGDDLAHVVPLVEDLVGAGAHLFAAFHAPGTAVIDFLDGIAGAIEAIPTPLLEAATTAYIAYRTAVTITAGLDAGAAALARLTGAETAAAVGATRLGAGGAAGAAGAVAKGGIVAGIASRVVPIAAVWAGAAIGFGALDDETQKWRGSIDETNNALGDTVKTVHDLFAFNWGSLADDLTGLPDRQNAARDNRFNAQTEIGVLGIGPNPPDPSAQLGLTPGIPADYAVNARAAIVDIHDQELAVSQLRAQLQTTGTTTDSLRARMSSLSAAGKENSDEFRYLYSTLQLFQAVGLKVADSYQEQRQKLDGYRTDLKSYRQIQDEVNASADRYAQGQSTKFAALSDTTFAQNPAVTSGITGLTGYQKTLAAAIKAEKSWTDVTGDDTVTIGKNTYATKAWDAAVAAAHGNTAKAAGLLLGHTRALQIDTQSAAVAADEQQNLSGAVGAAELKYHLSDAQLNQYASSLGITSQMLATGTVSQHTFVVAVGEAQRAIDDADTATAGWEAALAQFNSGTDTAASRAQLLAAAMVSLNGPTLEYASTGAKAAAANQQFVTDFNAAKKSVVNLKTGFIDFHNAGAAPLLSDLQNLQSTASQFAAQTYQDEVATRGRTQAARDAADVYRNDTRGALMDEASQLGITRGEAQKLADRYFKWPKDAETQIRMLGADDTNTLLNGIGQQLAILTGHPWTFNIDAHLTPNAVKFLSPGTGVHINPQTGLPQGPTSAASRAVGGGLPFGWSSVGEGGPAARPELIFNDGSGHPQVFSTVDSQAIVDATGMVAPGFASGTNKDKPLFTGEGPNWYDRAFAYMHKYARPNPSGAWQYQTTLPGNAAREFERWVQTKHVPFDPGARIVDYDMRGYWKKTRGRGWHPGSHFPDTFKTPYDTTFSNESKYADSKNRLAWHGQRLINEATGQLVFGPAIRPHSAAARIPGFAFGTRRSGPGGFTGVQGAGSGGGGSSGSGNGSGSGSGSGSGAADQAKLDAARSSARSDLTAFLSAIGITTNALTAAENTLIDALKSAKVSTSELAKVTRETARLVDIAKSITTETDRINKAQTHLSNVEQHQQQVQQAAKQEGASVRDSIISFLDLSTAGVQQQVYRDRPVAPLSAQSILQDVRSAADKGVATEGDLAKLKGHIPDSLYEQLAGNAAQDQPQIAALAAGSQKTRDAIARQYERLRKAGKGTGADVVDELFGGKLAKAQGSVDVAEGLLHGVDPAKNPALAKAVRHLADKMFGAGKETAKGLAEGLIAERSGLRHQLRQLGHELANEIRDDIAGRTPDHHTKHHPHRNGGGGNNAPDVQVNFNGPVNDPRAVENHLDYALLRASRRGRH